MKEVIKIFEITMKQEVQSIRVFPGGFSNDNYIINNDYIFRRKKHFIQPFYDSFYEKGIEEYIKDKSITIPCYYIDEKGNKITPFIHNGVHLSKSFANQDHIKLVAQKLRKLHNIDYQCEKNFSYFNRLIYYREEAFVHKHPLEDEIISLYNKYSSLYPLVPCHNDLNETNILCVGSDIFFIDFECACKNLALYDIYCFLSQNDITDKNIIYIFLKEYFQDNMIENIEQVTKDFFKINDLIRYYYSSMMFKKFKDKKYLDMATKCFFRLEKNELIFNE